MSAALCRNCAAVALHCAALASPSPSWLRQCRAPASFYTAMRAYATALLSALPRLQHCRAMQEQPVRNAVLQPLTLTFPRAQTSWTGFTVVTLVAVVMVVGAAYMLKEYRQALSEAGTQPKKKVSVKKTKREAMKRGMRGQN